MEKEIKETIDLAEEHLRLAQNLVLEEYKKGSSDPKREKEFKEAQFALEKAESEVADLEEL